MLIRLFHLLREYRVPVSIRELLDLLGVLRAGTLRMDTAAFYFVARLTLVKDERFYDRFDRAWAHFVDGLDSLDAVLDSLFAEDLEAQLQRWLGQRRALTATEQAQLAQLVADYRQAQIRPGAGNPPGEDADREAGQGGERGQDGADDANGEAGKGGESGQSGDDGENGDSEDGEDGNGEDGRNGSGESGEDGEDGRGSGGDSPQGVDGDSTAGIRDAHTDRPQQRAVAVWEERLFADLDDRVELGTRNFKVALRRLRRMARTDPEEELDLDATIAGTARNGGILDIRMAPLRRNSVKVLLLLDIGGSMDEHVEMVERLFVAARSEFKYLQEFWFHNCVYEHVWTDARRRDEDRVALFDVLRRYPRDWKVVLVGDAHMNRDELVSPGGSLEHANAESGAQWLGRLAERFPTLAWINPRLEADWQASITIPMVRSLTAQRMYPLTNEGLEAAMRRMAR